MEKTLLDNIREQKDDQRGNIINELGIFELRGLAREIGVPSPTTRKRDELVDLILEKLDNGVSAPTQSKTRKGRPCKTLNNLNQIMTAMTGGEETLSFTSVTKRIKPYEEVITFAQETPVFSLLESQESGNFEGVLRFSTKIGYFLDVVTRTKVFISLDSIKKYDLKSGDYLQVYASKMNASNQYIANNIKSINFESASKYQAVKKVDKKPIISYDTLAYGNFKLNCGRRNILQYSNNIYEDDRFVNFAKKLIADGYKIVVLGLNMSFEDSIMLNNLDGVVKLCTNYADDVQNGLDKVVDAITLVERLSELGKKVVLFVNDIMEIVNTLELCFDNNEKIMGHSAEAVVIAQKLISTAKAFDDKSEITLVLTYRNYNKDDMFLINEVFKVGKVFV